MSQVFLDLRILREAAGAEESEMRAKITGETVFRIELHRFGNGSQRRVSVSFQIFLDAEILVRKREPGIEIHGVLKNLLRFRTPANREETSAICLFLSVSKFANVKLCRRQFGGGLHLKIGK